MWHYSVTNADTNTFETLSELGFIEGGQKPGMAKVGTEWNGYHLSTVKLKTEAFQYYDQQHEFPSALTGERREFVDSSTSTEYPK